MLQNAKNWHIAIKSRFNLLVTKLPFLFSFRFSDRTSNYLTRWLFLRILGFIYLIAFLSIWVQIPGLIGSHGILPAENYLQAIQNNFGSERFWLFPTLYWLNPTDAFLNVLCGGGTILAILLIIGVMPTASLFLLWLFYLSILTIGQDFLSFQWDILLLETGFLAIFFAPLQIRPGLSRESPPSVTILWLLRWLLFRLIFSSGVVKLMSGDPTWRSLTALNYHYETQPLPTWVGWYMQQLPEFFQMTSVVAMFGVELIVPFLIFTTRKGRQIACGAFILLQLLIMATGNYCFFNLLTLILCVLLLDDSFLKRFFPKPILARFLKTPPQAKPNGTLIKKILIGFLAALIFIVSGIQIKGMFTRGADLPGPAQKVLSWVAPFRTINSYGLFAVMTTTRNEIIIQGSDDQRTWLTYEFKWKPCDIRRRPGWVAPHQPRVDWQMWFAALRSYEHVPWFTNFLVRLLTGTPEVLDLLDKNPFPDTPPQYIRAVVHEYHFTDLKKKQATGAWWRREFRGLYCPVLSLRQK